MKMDRFQRMAKDSKNSEELIMDWLCAQYGEQFELISEEVQIMGVEHGWHVPDLKHTQRNLYIEVKEDKSSAITGNLAFEKHCISRLKRWASYHNARVLLAYVNHKDFHIDIFACNFDTGQLVKELDFLCAYRADCKELNGGDQLHPLWIIPLQVSRKMVSCITNQVMLQRPRRIFSELAKEKLIR